ncbi:Wzz/FepE/Etk N-terminal domain-containing protein [Massilia sp. R2A-15]|uniref:GumC family protein n=1 Tax=Massilia sp. R2A-15 TaxID=3064278 RepID=UPI002735111F|nr:Wzz/FepE/Etk N-terminal domain-containing protein [Massilia sp. R2A-15]WLI88047.1 Wzz/FepE/Etk N-terminal domain-containing protein [Massilia sp. R2A-15]
MMPDHAVPSTNLPLRKDAEFSMLDVAIVVAKRKKFIVSSMLVAAVLAAGVSLLIPNTYTGTAQILPPQQQSGASALLGQLSSLGGSVGQSLGVKNPNDTYVAMLNSRTVSDNLIKRFDLSHVYDKESPTDLRTELALRSTIFSGKDGVISIQVDDKNPKRAALLANGYVQELQKLTQTLAVTEASQRRLFFEKQLILAKEGLANAEAALKAVQEKTGLIQLTGQAEAVIRAAAELKAQIGAKEVALGAMRTFATNNNPEIVKLEQELTGMRQQLRKLETGMNAGHGDVSVSTSQVPQAGLEYIRKVRDVKYYETVFELIAKQFELAKIDEAKEGSIIQVLDSAIEPDKKTKPARSIIVLVAALLGLLLAAGKAVLDEVLSKSDAGQRARLSALRDSLRWKS